MFSEEKLEIGQLIGHNFNKPDTAWGWLRIRRVAWKQNWEAQSPKTQRKKLKDLAMFQDSGTGKTDYQWWDPTESTTNFLREAKQTPISSLRSHGSEKYPKGQIQALKKKKIGGWRKTRENDTKYTFLSTVNKSREHPLQKQTQGISVEPWIWHVQEA